jgi:hypothetical protein
MVYMGPYAGADYRITSPYVQSRVDSNIFTIDNPMLESTLSPSQKLRIWPQVTKQEMSKKADP